MRDHPYRLQLYYRRIKKTVNSDKDVDKSEEKSCGNVQNSGD